MDLIIPLFANLVGVVFGYLLCLNHLDSGKLKQMRRKVRNHKLNKYKV